MPIYHDVAQYGLDYDKLKCGIPTSSNFNRIITPIEGSRSAQWNDYKFQLIAERLLGHRTQTYQSPAMERGMIVEAEAVEWYELDREAELDGGVTRKIGFVTTNDEQLGCSPDRLVNGNGLLEIKSADVPARQIKYHLDPNALRSHKSQLQGQLLVCEPDREWVDILAWWPDVLPKKILRVTRDERFIALMREMLNRFLEEVEEGVERMTTAGYIHVPEAKRTLLAALQASLDIQP